MSAPKTIAGITEEMLRAAWREFTQATRGVWYLKENTPRAERVKAQARADAAAQRLNTLEDICRLGFAEEHGWRWDRKQSVDHRDVFTDPKTKRVAATVYHGTEPYRPKPAVGEELPFSWRGNRYAVLVTELV